MNRKIVVVSITLFIFSFAQQRDSIVRVGACTTPGTVWGVYVSGNYAYIATRAGLAIVDVSIPSSPNMVSYIDNFFISALGVAVIDTVAVLNAELIGRLTNIGVANSSSPYLLGWCFTNSCVGFPEPKGISVLDNIAYQAIGNLGFWIVDITNPDTPVVIDSFKTSRRAIDLFVKDTLVYVADYDSLQIVNVAASPFRVGAVAMPNLCYDVFLIDTFAYVVCQSSFGVGTNGSVQVVNVSNPTSPQIVASINTLNADPKDIWISGNYAYVAAADFWFVTKGIKKGAGGLRPEGAFNMRADIEGGLRIVNISDPLNPTLVASYDTPGDPRGVFTIDTLVFIADYDSLQILKHRITGIEEINDTKHISNFDLHIRPNPINNEAIIHYQLPASCQVSLQIFDITGRLVKLIFDEHQKPGIYTVEWNGKDRNNQNVANGVYLCCLKTQASCVVKKLIITK
jgi:hypothetical protein